jgi:transposase InsO family protein
LLKQDLSLFLTVQSLFDTGDKSSRLCWLRRWGFVLIGEFQSRIFNAEHPGLRCRADQTWSTTLKGPCLENCGNGDADGWAQTHAPAVDCCADYVHHIGPWRGVRVYEDMVLLSQFTLAKTVRTDEGHVVSARDFTKWQKSCDIRGILSSVLVWPRLREADW